MAIFAFGLFVFFGSHLWTALARGQRERLIAKIGARAYRGLYSLAALAGFALIIIGWRDADASLVYTPPAFMKHLTYLFAFIALVLLASAYLPKGKIGASAKHPMLGAVKFWAFGHLLSNGEVRSIMLFGAFLAFAVIDRIVVKKRNEPTPVSGPVRNDILVVAAGFAAWAAIYFFAHPYIAGVALRP